MKKTHESQNSQDVGNGYWEDRCDCLSPIVDILTEDGTIKTLHLYISMTVIIYY